MQKIRRDETNLTNLTRDNRGFTMVEMIITIAIMAVLLTAVVTSFNIINSGRASKSTARLLSRLDATQVEDMTKKGLTYLYLYKDSDGIKTLLYNDGTENGLNSRDEVLANTSNGVVTDIAGSGVDFTANSDGTSENSKDTNNLVIKIAFDKASGAFKCSKMIDAANNAIFYKEIQFQGSGTTSYSVKLVKDTGKHMKG